MTNKQPLTKRKKREAKKLFAKQSHSTRPFTLKDYENFPKGETNAA
jgi:hypothetical protein